jgi:hypothetical protein
MTKTDMLNKRRFASISIKNCLADTDHWFNLQFWRSSPCVLHPQARLSSGAENEEKRRTAIYTISHRADVSACMLRTSLAKERLPDRALTWKEMPHDPLRNTSWCQQVSIGPS